MENAANDQSVQTVDIYTDRSGGQERLFQPVPWQLWAVALIFAGFGCFSLNPVLTPFSVALVPILVGLLWFRGEPPVLIFACAIQWLQAAIGIFYTNFSGVSLTEGSAVSETELAQATWLSLIGVLVLALGMRLALRRRLDDVGAQLNAETRSLEPARIFILYLIALVLFSFLDRAAFSIPSLTQPLRATVTLKWVLVFLIGYSVLAQRRHYALLATAVVLEFVYGLLGYFSGFKSILYMLVLILPTVHFVFTRRRFLQLCTVIALVLLSLVVWSAIKEEYREFLNQGSGQQLVLVPVNQRVEKLTELVSNLDVAKLQGGFAVMVARISYVQFFAATMSFVPAYVPHENGSLWWGAIEHVLMPRFLFPDKPAINDSDRTNHYTGLHVATAEQGTSISIGYMGESYIDFGPVWMFAPILLLGMFYGFIYRFFVHHQPVKVIGFAMATSILIFGAYNIETSNIKLVGGNMMSLLVIGLFAKIAGPWFWRQIAKPLDGLVSEYTPAHTSIREDIESL